MNNSLKAILIFMLSKKYIGAKHTPEKKLIRSKTKWLQKNERKEFQKEYNYLVNNKFIIKTKKRTGKGMDWHLCLNPRKIKEIFEIVGDENE